MILLSLSLKLNLIHIHIEFKDKLLLENIWLSVLVGCDIVTIAFAQLPSLKA